MCDWVVNQVDVLHEEEPSPAGLAEVSSKVEDPVSQEARDNATQVRRHPEECKANGQLGLRIVI